ncbi:glucose 1-dehydrogenase [Loigolactobacillus jiayinensis]|uniref:Glucose 1-dehydrogenase n=1 Tax=Loigolactobacillus jiayinensis TaxID=2486016 RepID=A0ABW1RGI0_9LACO|nr:glucose 1-dehydrogenase [Loigolactobacillus jiayinensis]
MGRLDGKVAVISGGTRGIGLATAKRFIEEGAKVVVTGRNAAVGQDALQELGSSALFVQHDVAKEADWIEVFKQTIATFGKVDVVFNNAGMADFNDAEHVTEDAWHKVLSVNLDGVMFGVKHGIQNMKDTGGGSIINMCSIEGLIGYPSLFAFSASKGGVRMLSKSAALYCAKQKYGIRVNSIYPGPIHKPEMDGDPAEKKLVEAHLPLVPLGRFGETTEVANLALFLASNESSFSTGSEFVLDGGYTAQ